MGRPVAAECQGPGAGPMRSSADPAAARAVLPTANH